MSLDFLKIKKDDVFYESGQSFGNILVKAISEPYFVDSFLFVDCICVDGENVDVFNKTFKFNTDKNLAFINPRIYLEPAYFFRGDSFSSPWNNFNRINHPLFFDTKKY